MITRFARFSVAALMLASPALSQAPAAKTDLTGKWAFTVTTDNGTGTPTVTIAQKGDSISGVYSSQVFGEQAIKGTVSGNKIAFSFTASAQGQSLAVSYTGTIEPDGSLKGSLDLGGFGTGTFTAKRAGPSGDAPAAPAAPAPAATGLVRIGTPQSGATLFVNDKEYGSIGSIMNVTVPSGSVMLSIRSPNCTPWDSTVIVRAGGQETIGRRILHCK